MIGPAAAALVALSAAGGAGVMGPVAVMPFKNLNKEPSLEWLRVGIAETMVSDLRKYGSLAVVERSQLDKALAEMALQGAQGTEESTAVKVGKMVGARTIVVGSFQSARKQLRITARFVTVETGVVQDTAKVTGAQEAVFALQDEIVARLIGPEYALLAPGVRPSRKPTPKVFSAYRLYAMALTTASDADRIGYLKQSIAEDPEFSYALDDLKALEGRMVGYSRAAEVATVKRTVDARAALDEPGLSDEERHKRATALLTADLTGLRWRALVEDARKVQSLRIPPQWGLSAREMAGMYLVSALSQLKLRDEALKEGERFLAEYPASMYFKSVELQMSALIEDKRQIEEGKKKLPERLAAIDLEASRAAAAEQRREDLRANDRRTADNERCNAAMSLRQYALAVEYCRAFVEKWTGPRDETTLLMTYVARLSVMRALTELGRFDEARAEAAAMERDDPERARQFSIKTQVGFLPKD